jgi:hypothetical protein
LISAGEVTPQNVLSAERRKQRNGEIKIRITKRRGTALMKIEMADGVPGGMGHSDDPCVAAAFEEIGFPLGVH